MLDPDADRQCMELRSLSLQKVQRWIRRNGDAIVRVASVFVEQDYGSGSAQFGTDCEQVGGKPFGSVGCKLQIAKQHAVLVQH